MDLAGGCAKPGNADTPKMQDMKKLFESVQITANGPIVVITLQGPVDSVGGFNKGGGFGGL